MKFLVDMNLSPGWVDRLAKASFDAIHWSKIASIEASDAEVMHWAAQQDFIVLTNDLDFGAILAATQRQKPSVIQIRGGNLHPDAIGDAVIAAIEQSAVELATGAIISIDALRHRLPVLPL